MRGRILYGILGVVLAAGTVLTGSYGLSERNMDIYKEALSLQKQVDELGFDGFSLADYKVRCYDGSYDYVLSISNGKAVKEKEKSVLQAFVGTAYEIDGEYQVIVPSVERFQEMISALRFGAGGDLTAFSDSEYGSEEQVATIWHEATHAWQFSRYEKEILNRVKAKDSDSRGSLGEVIANDVDSNPKVVSFYEQELEILKKAVLVRSIDDKKAYVLQYKKLEEERRHLLSEKVVSAEEYYENVEGMAYYLESKVYEMEKGTDAYSRQYLDAIGTYTEGTHKYYTIGMAKCLLLDALQEDWKAGFDFSESLSELLYESIEQ
ncbi:MAG: hypothetical protein E7256_05735 [Lachnospiraceae bacterium]|nr:hypothetical protein [Lachnospiraceae bacterium]